MAVKEVDQSANSYGRYDGANTDSGKSLVTAIEKGYAQGHDNQGRIEGHFSRTHANLRRLSNGFYNAVTGNHEDLRGHFQADAEGQDGTAHEKDEKSHRPGMSLQPR